ncbi:ATP-binding cassette domain-containing protein [Cellulomonas sp. B6]|uniref:ATP-binding cassette domain-containing protein n=1 Tax=Cellulomonas sp. B6 TaxID=1295626 RepID=UPI00073BF35B|nr:ATP-binding cassette domain-containing protein [Cellulomonas sp. B6]KSW19040.1 multidrug ABC transporter ATP-binding protein [Cellulomonas sp. B6]
MIEAHRLTKRYGPRTVVDGMTFTVQPGRVTGFLGPNGAGKSTTMRMTVGLDRPHGGTVTVNGAPYARHRAPLAEVGVLLDAKAVHPGRSARAHLRALAATHGISNARVDEVIDLAGLTSVAHQRAGRFSLGMGQRLGIAAALLGDPATLILDEPVNGLDPEGVLWVRTLLRSLAAEGRTVFLSSHLMSEMALTADHLVVVGRGRVVADAPVADIVARAGTSAVRVRTPETARLADALTRDPALRVVSTAADTLEVSGADAPTIAAAAAGAGVVLHELAPVQASLEDAYLQLTGGEVEYRAAAPDATAHARPTSGAHR